MKVTVSDCLGLGVFSGARVIAGRDGLENVVKAVSVLEASGGDEAVRFGAEENQFTFTSFSLTRDDEDAQCTVIRALADGGNAGLAVFYEGDVADEIGKKVMAEAEKENFPLIVMDQTRDISEAITEVTGRLYYGEYDAKENRIISSTVMDLLDFDKYESFAAAARAAAINNAFQLVILSNDFNPVFTVETRYRTTVEKAISCGMERSVFTKSPVGTLIDVEGVLTYWWPIKLGGEDYFMFLVDDEDTYSSGEITKLAEIVELAMGMWKFTPVRDAKTELINALRRGNLKLAFSLMNETEVDPSNIVSVFFARGLGKAEQKKISAELGAEPGFSVMKTASGDETYGMILREPVEGQKNDDYGKSACIALYNKLKQQRKIRIFHVTGLSGLEGAFEGYRLIGEAQAYAEKVFPYKRVFTKYDLSLVSNCISIQVQGGYMMKDFADLLNGFDEIGENKGRQLLDTLETFVLDAGMNSGKTAEFMGIHTNTVQYRLKRINEVLGAEITGNRVLPGLTIAIALKRLEEQDTEKNQ